MFWCLKNIPVIYVNLKAYFITFCTSFSNTWWMCFLFLLLIKFLWMFSLLFSKSIHFEATFSYWISSRLVVNILFHLLILYRWYNILVYCSDTKISSLPPEPYWGLWRIPRHDPLHCRGRPKTNYQVGPEQQLQWLWQKQVTGRK